MAEYDYIIVGSGINALVAAAMLGRKRQRVLVLERNETIGGCLRTEEMTAPGFVHDVMATTMVLFQTSPAFAALGKELEERGLEFCHTEFPTGVLRPDGSHLVFSRDRERNIAAFDAAASGDGAAFAREMEAFGADANFVFALLGGNLWSASTFKLILRQAFARGFRKFINWFAEALMPARGYLTTTYASEDVRALWAPWALHCGLGPDSSYSASMIKVIGFAVELAGCPIVKGGAQNLTRAFERLITDLGGTVRTSSDVDMLLPGNNGRAAGVTLADGTTFHARKGVIASMTPHQLYGRLLREWPAPLPETVSDGLKAYRFGKGNMQVHYALKSPPRWKQGGDLGKVALLHLTPDLDGVALSSAQAECGLLPGTPTICVGQPTALDPSRAPEGAAVLWLQIPDAPRHVKGDAAGEIECPSDGQWTDALRESFAERIEAILASHIDGFSETVISRRAYSPADLEKMNVNLVGGDPYGGFCGLDQFFLWRPFKTSVNHRTHVDGLYHIGASTHPGPGLAGGSGYLLASGLK